MADWEGIAAFCDPAPKRNYAGQVGFLEYWLFADRGSKFYVDPVPNFPGNYNCSADRSVLAT